MAPATPRTIAPIEALPTELLLSIFRNLSDDFPTLLSTFFVSDLLRPLVNVIIESSMLLTTNSETDNATFYLLE